MQNKIPETVRGMTDVTAAPSPGARTSGLAPTSVVPTEEASLVGQAVDRSLEGRRAAAREEVERLIHAAFRVIERSGELEPKVSDILAEAGLSNQAFYRHFRSKRALLVAVLDEGIRGLGDYLRARMQPALDTDDPAADERAIREWIRGMAAQAMHPQGADASRPFALARGRLAESFPADVAQSERQVTAPLREVLEAARRSGRLPTVEPDLDAENLYHLMMGWVEARLIARRIPAEAELDRIEAFAMAGLGAGGNE